MGGIGFFSIMRCARLKLPRRKIVLEFQYNIEKFNTILKISIQYWDFEYSIKIFNTVLEFPIQPY